MSEYEKVSGVNSEDSLLVIYILRILKKYSTPDNPLSSQDVMTYLKEDYSIGSADTSNAQKKKIRRHMDTLHDCYGQGCIGKVEGKTTREGHKWFYDASRDKFADEGGSIQETLSGVEIDFIVDIIASCKILNSESTIALIDKLLKKTDLDENERERRLNEIRAEKWAKSLNAELVAIKEELESYTDECCTISFDYNSESILASPCDVLFRDGKYILDAKVGDEYREFLIEKIKNLKKTNYPYDFDDDYFDTFAGSDKSDDTTLETLFLNVPIIKDAIKKKTGIEFKYLSYAVDYDEVVLVGKDKHILPHSLVFNDGKYYLIGYDGDRAKIDYFRVDLISNLSISKTKINISDWNAQVLDGMKRAREVEKHPLMLSGIDSPVTFLVLESALDRVIDAFGKSVQLQVTKETKVVPDYSSHQKWSDNPSDAELSRERLVAVKVRTTYEEAFRWALANADAVELVYPPELRHKLRRIAPPIHRTYAKTLSDKVQANVDSIFATGSFKINQKMGEDLASETFKVLNHDGNNGVVHEIRVFGINADQIGYAGNFINAKWLDITKSHSEGPQWIANLTELVNLHLSMTSISDVSWLENLKKLKVVRLIQSPITDLSVLREHQNILFLDLRNLDIRDIRFIENQPRLLNLKLVGCPIEDYSPLLRMNPLDYLKVDEKAIEAIGMENLIKHHPDAVIEVQQKIDNRKV